jgi:hypothetical protein
MKSKLTYNSFLRFEGKHINSSLSSENLNFQFLRLDGESTSQFLPLDGGGQRRGCISPSPQSPPTRGREKKGYHRGKGDAKNSS